MPPAADPAVVGHAAAGPVPVSRAVLVWRRHWPEYAMEAALLGGFMVSACLFAVLLFHPAGVAAHALPDPLARRVLMGLAMGATAIALTYSPWGQQSGAHYNPAVTLTFARLGKVAPWDAVAYVAAQFAGAVLGVMAARVVLREMLRDAQVHYAVTRPGASGVLAAFGAETLISFLLMTVVLAASNHPKAARYTGVFAGLLVATFIIVESPVSGMSMNPARTVGSGFWAGDWTALWIYFTAPPLGMLLAAERYLRRHGPGGIFCAKLHHQNSRRCIFCGHSGSMTG
jgi:aquaporin Z